MSRALRELSNREKDLKVKQKLLEDALKIAELSLDLKHNNWAAHKWIGIILGDLKGLQGTKALLEASPQIKVNIQIIWYVTIFLYHGDWYHKIRSQILTQFSLKLFSPRTESNLDIF